ncbi:DUF5316 domain-containing protein [Bacillus gobiensis]|uniref:DUF5316 domain-containing protein n=1 Tax=Bacillus gobiensis TaxID=1441095 RepID=A0A0M5JAD4_9BACI|nr:DUF5316 domain-containing protein [Bacillus gobiensis]ALC82489.1 hypothetical protein AM592_13515 [Bacillus gobiensis]
MKKFFYAGLLSTLASIICSLLTNDTTYIYKVAGTLAVIGIILSGLYLQTFTTEFQQRGHSNTESKEDRKQRTDSGINWALFALPNTLCCIVVFLFF